MIVYPQDKINALFKASDYLDSIRDDKKTYFSVPLMAFRSAITNLRFLENTIFFIKEKRKYVKSLIMDYEKL